MRKVFEDYLDRVSELPDDELLNGLDEHPILDPQKYDVCVKASILAEDTDASRLPKAEKNLQMLFNSLGMDFPGTVLSTNDAQLSKESDLLSYDEDLIWYFKKYPVTQFAVQFNNPMTPVDPANKKAIVNAVRKIVYILANIHRIVSFTMKTEVQIFHGYWSTGNDWCGVKRPDWIALCYQLVYPDNLITTKQIKDIINEVAPGVWSWFYHTTSYGNLESVKKILRDYVEQRVEVRHQAIYSKK